MHVKACTRSGDIEPRNRLTVMSDNGVKDGAGELAALAIGTPSKAVSRTSGLAQ